MILIEIEKEKNNQVIKANSLIKAMGNLSATSTKMLAMIISMIKENDTELQEYALNIKNYLELVGSNTHNTELIKKSAEELMKNPFWIDKKLFNWCSMVDIEKIEGYIVFDINKYLKPYLLEIKSNFTKYEIINILKMKGEYTPRVYEYLIMKFNEYKNGYMKKYNKKPKTYTLEIEIDWLREYLKIPESYKYDVIKRNIINKAQEQLKEQTNIKFEYEEKKLGKKVIALKIKIENNEKGSNDFLKDEHAFIAYMRKNFINKEILQAFDTKEKRPMIISIAPDGILYDKTKIEKINSKRSKEIWGRLYQLACDKKIPILNEILL